MTKTIGCAILVIEKFQTQKGGCMFLGRLIQGAREEAGLTQKEFAPMVGRNRPSEIANIEAGFSLPADEFLSQICFKLNLKYEKLLEIREKERELSRSLRKATKILEDGSMLLSVKDEDEVKLLLGYRQLSRVDKKQILQLAERFLYL